jgi:hypothetical protein
MSASCVIVIIHNSISVRERSWWETVHYLCCYCDGILCRGDNFMTDCQLIVMKYFTDQYRGDNSMRAYQLIAFLL